MCAASAGAAAPGRQSPEWGNRDIAPCRHSRRARKSGKRRKMPEISALPAPQAQKRAGTAATATPRADHVQLELSGADQVQAFQGAAWAACHDQVSDLNHLADHNIHCTGPARPGPIRNPSRSTFPVAGFLLLFWQETGR